MWQFFFVPVNHKVTMKEIEKIGKYLDLVRGEAIVEQEGDNDSNWSCYPRNGP